jgi:hypothetical protein
VAAPTIATPDPPHPVGVCPEDDEAGPAEDHAYEAGHADDVGSAVPAVPVAAQSRSGSVMGP